MSAGQIDVSFKVNGVDQQVAIDGGQTLAQVLRSKLGLTGSKIGCNQGVCGACTVFVNGVTVRGCLTLAASCQGKEVLTIEGYAQGDELKPIQQAFIDTAAAQCGYCTSGMIASAQALLDTNTEPTVDDVRQALAGNMCRCTGYKKIIDAVLLASKRINEGGEDHV